VSIQKKSLINTLKSAKKANVVKEEVTVSGATVSASKSAPVRVLRTTKNSAPAKALRAGKAPRVMLGKKPTAGW
jgi:hypothetical protein